MAVNIFEQNGIHEVADVQLEDTVSGEVVLYLDTLKISTLEQTADQSESRGGKGNPVLIIWDFNKEITVTLQDAVVSMASLAVCIGGSAVAPADLDEYTIRKTEVVVQTSATPVYPSGVTGSTPSLKYINVTRGTRGVGVPTVVADDVVRFFWDIDGDDSGAAAYIININPSTFPGTYKVVGDTLKRNTNGTDSAFQFEGDPSVFDMTLRVLRDPTTGKMMYFVAYTD